jgi:hypothetical protein
MACVQTHTDHLERNFFLKLSVFSGATLPWSQWTYKIRGPRRIKQAMGASWLSDQKKRQGIIDWSCRGYGSYTWDPEHAAAQKSYTSLPAHLLCGANSRWWRRTHLPLSFMVWTDFERNTGSWWRSEEQSSAGLPTVTVAMVIWKPGMGTEDVIWSTPKTSTGSKGDVDVVLLPNSLSYFDRELLSLH